MPNNNFHIVISHFSLLSPDKESKKNINAPHLNKNQLSVGTDLLTILSCLTPMKNVSTGSNDLIEITTSVDKALNALENSNMETLRFPSIYANLNSLAENSLT